MPSGVAIGLDWATVCPTQHPTSISPSHFPANGVGLLGIPLAPNKGTPYASRAHLGDDVGHYNMGWRKLRSPDAKYECPLVRGSGDDMVRG
jgi:hypothetical protein